MGPSLERRWRSSSSGLRSFSLSRPERDIPPLGPLRLFDCFHGHLPGVFPIQYLFFLSDCLTDMKKYEKQDVRYCTHIYKKETLHLLRLLVTPAAANPRILATLEGRSNLEMVALDVCLCVHARTE